MIIHPKGLNLDKVFDDIKKSDKVNLDKYTDIIKELKRLYVLFHQEAEKDETLNDEGRAWFKKLEDGDPEAIRIWEWFREESLKEFQKTYDLLGINSFDSYNGEAYYNDKMDETIKMLEDKALDNTSRAV